MGKKGKSMTQKNTLLKPYVRFHRVGSDFELHYLCEYVVMGSDGVPRHFGTRQERDRWLDHQAR